MTAGVWGNPTGLPEVTEFMKPGPIYQIPDASLFLLALRNNSKTAFRVCASGNGKEKNLVGRISTRFEFTPELATPENEACMLMTANSKPQSQLQCQT